MSDKSLKKKAVKIQGKDYVLVADRVAFFNETYPNGSIRTELVSEPKDTTVIVKAFITPDHKEPARFFTGYSQAVIGQGNVNKTAALENAETSAVGRGLGLMGIGVIESIASADEMHKALKPAFITPKNVLPMPEPHYPCDNVACKGKSKYQDGLCYQCYKATKEGAEIKKRRSEGALNEEEVPWPDMEPAR